MIESAGNPRNVIFKQGRRWLFIEKYSNSCCKFLKIICLAFPDDKRFPAQLFQLAKVSRVTLTVSFQFFDPVCFVGFWNAAFYAASFLMLVPETAMYENHLFSRSKDQVRFPGQIFPVQPVPVTHAMHKSADTHFRLHVLRADSAHVGTTPFWRNRICHKRNLKWRDQAEDR
jgi:hypothetical protein